MTYTPQCFDHATHADTGGGEPGPLLVWRFPEPLRTVSSGMLGGGVATSAWVINAQVRADYGRMDPAAHLAAIAREHGLAADRGVGLLTAARVERVATGIDGPQGCVVRCDATVGVSYPTWAAAPDSDLLPQTPWRPGTVNLVCQFPMPLTDAALVGAVITATEAKTQALIEGGMPGTGTASDAVVICAPLSDEPEDALPFAGPRSVWGARLARAVHRAVAAGFDSYRQSGGQ